MSRLVYKELSVVELIDLIKENQEHKAFGELYDRYVKTVYNKCLSFTRDNAEAEDITQEIFVKIYENLMAFDNKNFGGWLMRITYNACVDHGRKKSKKAFSNEVVETPEVEDEEEQIERELMEVKLDALEEILGQMDPVDRSMLILKYQEDKKVRELADIYDISQSAVKMRLSRARIFILNTYDKEYAGAG